MTAKKKTGVKLTAGYVRRMQNHVSWLRILLQGFEHQVGKVRQEIDELEVQITQLSPPKERKTK